MAFTIPKCKFPPVWGILRNKEKPSPQIFLTMPPGIQDHELKLELSLSEPGSLIRGDRDGLHCPSRSCCIRE